MSKKPIDVLIEALETGVPEKEPGGESPIVGFNMEDFQGYIDGGYLDGFDDTPHITDIDHLWPEEASCGTSACIAGTLKLIYPDVWRAFKEKHHPLGHNEARRYFGFTQEVLKIKHYDDAETLCNPKHHNLSTITRADAIACLKNLKETGEVDWDKAFNESE